MRIFIAIDLPREVRETLLSLQNDLRERLHGVRWVRPHGIHLTLRFIGEVGEEELEALRSSLGEEIPGFSLPFDLHVRGIGTFPETGRPRVLWVAVEEDGERLLSVQRKVEDAARIAGFEEERRPFRPHLTLGRFGSARRGPGLESVLEEHRDRLHGSFTVSSVSLFRSLLKPGGAEYLRLADYSLGRMSG